MSYNIYTSPAFIVSSTPRGEADRLYKIYTRDLGMINVVAGGIRKINSKLCPHLQEYREVNLSVVRGREMWRATSASVSTYYTSVFASNPTRTASARILSLVARLIHGEESHIKLYDILKTSFDILENNSENTEYISMVECLTVLNILNLLGYIRKNETLLKYITLDTANLSNIISTQEASFKADSKFIIKEINHALKESHL